MTVLLLGAGAPKSYAQSPTQTMPLARELFKTFCNLEIRQHPWVLLHTIATYLKVRRNMSRSDFFRANEDIERPSGAVHGLDEASPLAQVGDPLAQVAEAGVLEEASPLPLEGASPLPALLHFTMNAQNPDCDSPCSRLPS